MRISDWSSDVCSSDLLMLDALCDHRQSDGVGQIDDGGNDGGVTLLRVDPVDEGFVDLHDVERELAQRLKRDRKSVVSGKSVSVRVDLGGRRIITKNTLRHYRSKQTSKTPTVLQ